jgi:5-methylcytosine-specific restriction endonuclease McrA
MTELLRQFVRERARHRCEYCLLHQEDSPLAALHVEHIRPRKHGGIDSGDNLALACIDCNLRQGPNLTIIDLGIWHMSLKKENGHDDPAPVGQGLG